MTTKGDTTMQTTLVTTGIPDVGARWIADEDPQSVRDLSALMGASTDGHYRYEDIVAKLAEDRTINRVLAVRLNLASDHGEGLGDYELCELHHDPTFGVVGSTILEQGYEARREAAQRAATLLAA